MTNINNNSLRKFVANRIKYLRKEKKLSQEKLSEKADLEPKYINKVENEKYDMKIDTLDKVIYSLDMSLEEFFNFKFSNNSNEVDNLINSIKKLPYEKQKRILEALNMLIEEIV